MLSSRCEFHKASYGQTHGLRTCFSDADHCGRFERLEVGDEDFVAVESFNGMSI